MTIEGWIEAIDAVIPGARSLLTFDGSPLPFPADIQHDRLAELGDVPVTPYRDAIAATARIFQDLAAAGRLIGSEHGIRDVDASNGGSPQSVPPDGPASPVGPPAG